MEEKVNGNRKKPSENIVGKGENAGNQHFLLFPQCFLPFAIHVSSFTLHLFCRLQIHSIRTRSRSYCPVVSSSLTRIPPCLVISVYLSSLPVAHLSDTPRRRLVVTADSARIQDETTENSAWFFNVLGV